VTLDGTTSLKGNVRWMAPELVTPVDAAPDLPFYTKATDHVWALGTVVCMYVFVTLQSKLSSHKTFRNLSLGIVLYLSERYSNNDKTASYKT
jgi:hypothetical protein